MALDYFIRSGNRMLRCGCTTGTCAALAAAGATTLLLTGKAPETLRLVTPKGIPVEVAAADCAAEGETARCSVIKDAGDDPDVTDGIAVCARVRKTPRGVTVDGGEGVGRATKPGLDQPVGAAAINTVPRQMIAAALEDVCAEAGYAGGLAVEIFVPGGAAIAEKTYNPHLGIEGGISILGTSGIVEPMSEQALVDTIALEIRQAAATERSRLILTPGGYGERFLKEHLPELSEIPAVRCSNFLGDAIDIAAAEGFQSAVIVGHIGKLVKLAGGIMNTHSRQADCRRELFCAHAAALGAGRKVCERLLDEATTDGCIAALDEAGMREPVMKRLFSAMQEHLDRRAAGGLRVGAVVFSNEYGLLGMTPAAEELIREWSKT